MNEPLPAADSRLRFLLMQVRNPDDPMRTQEVECFAKALRCRPEQIAVYDLLKGEPSRSVVDQFDVVLLGGSGDYSVVSGGPWLPAALETMGHLVERRKPTFASCWGFQAMALACGGRVVTDLERAELGTFELSVTGEGRQDPVFGALGPSFTALLGHQDIVEELPPNARLLASSPQVKHEAFCFTDAPIYCTQFHPELDRQSFMQRVENYPQYVEKIVGMTIPQFARHCHDTPASATLLPRFLQTFLS